MTEKDDLLARVHREVGEFDYDGSKLPCIILDEERFLHIVDSVAGKPIAVNTNLNILHNDHGDVFVEILFGFSRGSVAENILLHANESLKFFELLAKHSVIVLLSKANSKVFMIQLPKPARTRSALDLIKSVMRDAKLNDNVSDSD